MIASTSFVKLVSRAHTFGLTGLLLGSCSGGVSTPDSLRGHWGEDCATPSLQIDEDSIHILYPTREDFDLTDASFDGRTFKASFVSSGKKITDIFVLENAMLRTTHVIVDGKISPSDNIAMKKCD